MSTARPRLLFWCQHSLGLGHLARALRLAAALADAFDVVIVSGGRVPAGTATPPGVTLVQLPPLGMDERFRLVSHTPGLDPAAALARRRDLLVGLLGDVRPAVLLVELWPFGRRKHEPELLPLLDAAASITPRPRVVCSVRDLLVAGRDDQAAHDDRVAALANERLDAILVHADPRFATLADTFRPRVPLSVPVHHTGFVAPRPAPDLARVRRDPRVLVSCGGGEVGAPLVDAAVGAYREIHRATGLTTRVVAGPFLPADAWAGLESAAAGAQQLEAVRTVPDLARCIAAARVSVSQAGYNTAMDLLVARTPAVLVPFGGPAEDEQRQRAARLERLGLARVVAADDCSPERLTAAVLAAAHDRPSDVDLALDGAERTRDLLARLVLEGAAA